MSLSGFASPLATEPKTRTLRAPCLAAMARISWRLAFVKAIFENNDLKLLDKLDLLEGEEVEIELKKKSIFGLLKDGRSTHNL
jgi:predicted DNA-binding antitoxin AbrB/MazE fold protein